MTNACIVGIGSDIGYEIGFRLISEGWRVHGTYHRRKPDAYLIAEGSPFPNCASVMLRQCDMTNHNHIMDAADAMEAWDLLIFAAGTMEPIGKLHEVNPFEFRQAVKVNALGPLMFLSYMLPKRRPLARVIFIGGPNLSVPTPTYTAYRAGKAMLAALCSTLAAEYPDCSFNVLNPGVVNTRIHEQTLAAGSRAANLERVRGIVEGEEPTVSHDQVFAKLKEML